MVQLYGTPGNDYLVGGSKNDELYGLAGNDEIKGGKGNDLLDGGEGADLLKGGLGEDTYIVDNVGDIVLEVAEAEFFGQVSLVSSSSSGIAANQNSSAPIFSPDGNTVYFLSNANNLVSNDTNGWGDIFAKNLQTGEVTLLSTAADGSLANNGLIDFQLSADGSKLVFSSYASNLVSNDTNQNVDVFVKDIATGEVTRVSTDANGSQLNASSFGANISADGTKVTFLSNASNLVPNDTNGKTDIFIKDLLTGEVARVNTDSQGNQAAFPTVGYSSALAVTNISADGTKVAFLSPQSNLVANDTNGSGDLFIKDLVSGETVRVNTSSSGKQAVGNYSVSGGEFSPDGTKIIFTTDANNLVAADTDDQQDIFIKDLITGRLTLVSTSSTGENSSGANAHFSADGNTIYFSSQASNLDPIVAQTNRDANSSAVYSKNLLTGQVTLLTINQLGELPQGFINSFDVTSDGKKIVFNTYGNLSGDALNHENIFIKDVSAEQRIEYDTVKASISYTLGNYVENLVLTGEASINGSGNSLNNKITGNAANNTLEGGSGNDILIGNAGDDILNGASGKDTLNGGIGNDTLNGGSGDDYLSGDSGDDIVVGGSGNDKLYGGSGADVLNGDNGNDWLEGNSGNDILNGGAGSDRLSGGSGDDILNGGAGIDVLSGDKGSDTAIFHLLNAKDATGGNDYDIWSGDDYTGGFRVNPVAHDIHADKIDVSELLIGYEANGNVSALAPYLKVDVSASNAIISIDRDGAGTAYGFSQLLILQNTHTNLATLFDNQQIIA